MIEDFIFVLFGIAVVLLIFASRSRSRDITGL